MKPLISVIVPIYNVEIYLNQCIESIINQTYSNLEIILVDDGSTDNSSKICDDWGKKDQRIKVIHKKNGGLSDARNVGLDIVSGDYISFIDSDDWVELNMLEILYTQLLNNNADICACGLYRNYTNRQEILKIKDIIGDANIIYQYLYNDTKYPVVTWNKLYKRELWENIRFPKGKLYEDAFTTYLLIDKAQIIVQISKPLYHYRIRSNSIMTKKFSSKNMDEEEVWRKNYEFIQIHYPQCHKIAYDFYLTKVNVLIHKIDDKNQFKNEYDFLLNILKKNFFYILFSSQLNYKSKIKILMDTIKLGVKKND